MFEPQIPENRVAFERYTKLMLHTIWIVPIMVLVLAHFVLGTVHAFDLDAELIDRIMIPTAFGGVGAAFLLMGYCEVQTILIFRRDLREQPATSQERRDASGTP